MPKQTDLEQKALQLVMNAGEQGLLQLSCGEMLMPAAEKAPESR